MKKLIVLFLAFMMVFALVACKDEPEESVTDTTASEDSGKAALVSQGSASSSKGVDNAGFKIVGTFNVSGVETKVEVGGKDGLFWIGQYTTADDTDPTYFYFRVVDDNTVSIYDGSSWTTFECDSIKDALFGEDGLYSAVIDNVLYLSFELDDTGLFGDLTYAGQGTYNGMTCSKYTATVSNSTLGDIATATVYLEPTYAVTVGFEFSLTESFASKYGTLAQTTLESLFNYEADADFSIDTSDIPDYAAVSATITN